MVGCNINFNFYNSNRPFNKVSIYLCGVPQSFSKQLVFDKKNLLAVIIPQLRKNGMYYEVNIKGYPRFFMSWSPLGRYDITPEHKADIPYQLVLAVSDIIEKQA
jgi:hypothetical protein